MALPAGAVGARALLTPGAGYQGIDPTRPRRAARAGPALLLSAPRSSITHMKHAQTFHPSRTAPPRPACEEQSYQSAYRATGLPQSEDVWLHTMLRDCTVQLGKEQTGDFSWRWKWQEKEQNGKKSCVFSHCSGNLLWQHELSLGERRVFCKQLATTKTRLAWHTSYRQENIIHFRIQHLLCQFKVCLLLF